MKYLFTLLIVIMFSSCATNKYVYEDTLYVTRKYCGDFDTSYVEGKCLKVVTSQCEFYIWGKITLDIPKGTKCYVKYFPEFTQMIQHWVLYFTYDGNDDFYMIKQNYITGKIY